MVHPARLGGALAGGGVVLLGELHRLRRGGGVAQGPALQGPVPLGFIEGQLHLGGGLQLQLPDVLLHGFPQVDLRDPGLVLQVHIVVLAAEGGYAGAHGQAAALKRLPPGDVKDRGLLGLGVVKLGDGIGVLVRVGGVPFLQQGDAIQPVVDGGPDLRRDPVRAKGEL